MMTEALPKKKNKILMYLIIAAVLASLIFLGYHFRNQWLPLFKKTNPVSQDSIPTSNDIDTITQAEEIQVTPIVAPKPPTVDTNNVIKTFNKYYN
ncbi:MAG: hypothetical protein IPL08_16375 [Saprospiraceae bacterium]|nr:hypothetical protein [Saprospiraceae bacterium]